MKNAFRFVSLVLIVTFLLSATGCGLVKSGISERDRLVALAQDVQQADSNFYLVMDTQYGKIQASNSVTAAYYESVAQAGEIWTGNFRSQQEALDKALANGATTTVGGDPSKPDLAAQTENGTLPSDTAAAFALYVNSVVQAPPPAPDSAVTLGMMDTINEGMNTIQLAGTDWNDAVRAYNTEIGSFTGAVVAEASKILGFPLPASFPYYQSVREGQSVTNPLGTTAP